MRPTILTASVLLSGCIASSGTDQPPEPATYYDYQLYSPTGKSIPDAQLTDELSEFDVILIGEWHTHPAIHLFQTRLLQSLHQHNPNIALSMEQFSRDSQEVINQYLNGEIGEQTLIKDGKGWPNYESDYRPLIEYAKANHLPVIAANATKSIVRCIGQEGLGYLDLLSEDERKQVAQHIDISDSPYKNKFMASMHHGTPEDNIRHYAAQVTWDETMAESVTNYIAKHPQYSVMHIAGKFHVEENLGIAASIHKRNPGLSIAVITPSSLLNGQSSDYQLLVLPPPERYIKEENKIKAIHKLTHRNQENMCKKPE